MSKRSAKSTSVPEQDMGSAPETTKWKIFLVIGLAQNSKHWPPKLIEALRRLSCVDDVVALDLPGAGRLSHERSPTWISDYVPVMRRYYQHELAASGTRLLVAISLGGMVASEWCLQHPEEFQKVILINTSFGGVVAAGERLRPSAWLQFLSIFLSRSPSTRVQRTLDLVSNHPEKRQEILPIWIDASREYPTGRINALRQLYAAWCYFAPARLPTNTVILCSRYDRLCSYTASERIAAHYGLPLIVDSTPTIGHAFHVDGVEEMMRIIENCVGDRLVIANS